MAAYPRFSPTERRKLTMSARARESFKTVGIRGGAGPGEGAPSAPVPYYTLSEEDRATFENTMNMTHDNDINKARTAKGAMQQAMKDFSPTAQGALMAAYNSSIGGIPIGAVSELRRLVFCFAGYCTETEWEIPDEPGFCSDGEFQAAGVKSVDIQGGTYNVTGGQAFNAGPGFAQTTGGTEEVTDIGGAYQYRVAIGNNGGCTPIICRNGTPIVTLGDCALSALGTHACPDSFVGVVGRSVDCDDTEFWLQYTYDLMLRRGLFADQGPHPNPCWQDSFSLSGDVPGYVEGDEITVGFRDANGTVRCDVLGNGEYDYSPTLNSMTPVGATDLPITDIPLDELCDLIDALQNDPNLQPYLPPPGTPPGTPGPGTPDPGAPPVIPPPIDAPPTQPPDPGTNPSPGIPPTDPGIPPGPGDPGLPPGDPGLPAPGELPTPDPVPGTDPIGDGIDDPGEGGCVTLSKVPAGFRDPGQPGGIARKYQPGQPMVIDYGEGSKCKRKIVKVKPSKGEDGGPEICVDGGIDNSGKTTEKTCYGPGPVEDAIRSVLGDMVAEGGNIIFDSDCARELHRPLCFRAGTSKRVILNKLLDMCGFCVFPMFDCNVIVGYCGPLNTTWTYHEDVDLIKFDLEYDGQEIYDYVEVFRGDFISRAGNVFVRGNSVLYPVGSPASSINGDRVYQYEVPYSTPDSELITIAMDLAAKLRTQALPEIAFGVPLNSMLALRHQLRIQMPSVGFDAYYMVTRLARDYDRENGHLSTGLARWLHAA